MAARAVPAGLGQKGAKFWREIQKDYELATFEEMLLEQACRELDLIARFERKLKTQPVVVKGSMGQDIANPLSVAIMKHRQTFGSLMKQLKLPALEDDKPRSAASLHGQAAANARWKRGA